MLNVGVTHVTLLLPQRSFHCYDVDESSRKKCSHKGLCAVTQIDPFGDDSGFISGPGTFFPLLAVWVARWTAAGGRQAEVIRGGTRRSLCTGPLRRKHHLRPGRRCGGLSGEQVAVRSGAFRNNLSLELGLHPQICRCFCPHGSVFKGEELRLSVLSDPPLQI